MSIIKMADLTLANKRVLIREDLNVPVAEGKITSDARLRAALPTLKLALEAGAKVMVMSHLNSQLLVAMKTYLLAHLLLVCLSAT